MVQPGRAPIEGPAPPACGVGLVAVNQADSPELREKLLNLAREWMHAVMDVEDAPAPQRANGRKHPNKD
jgi:hypothetical protein